MSRCNSVLFNLWQRICRNFSAGSNKSPADLVCKKTRWLNLVFTAMVAITIAACGSGGGGGGGSSAGGSSVSTDFVVSGTVSAPGGTVAFIPQKNMFAKLADVLISPAYAAISGLASVPDGTQVDLVRIDKAGTIISVLATTTTSGGSYSFNITKLGLTTASDLAVQVTNLSTGVKMRAFVGADGVVNLDPASETSVRIILDKIAATPSLSLNNFTTQELTDIASAVNLLISTQQLSSGADIETTVTTFKAAVSANTGFVAFVSAASAQGQSAEGPGDIGNYFPLSQGDTWFYSGTVSDGGLPSTSFNNIVTYTRSKPLNGVSVAVLSESNPGNAGADEIYLTKGTSGITNYGNNDAQDFFTQQLVPYQEIRFPQKIGASFEQINKSGLNWPDSDYDGRSEIAKAVSLVTYAGFEDVTVTAGNFSNCAKVVTVLTVTVTFSSDGSKGELTETDTSWYAPGVGSVKNTSVIEVTGQGIVFTETDQLTAYIVSGQANGISIQVAPSAASVGIGGTRQFTATAFDPFNNPISGVTFTWASSNLAVASIVASGLATGVANGTTQITASSIGIISSPVTLKVVDQRQIALATQDLIYDPFRNKIYASVPSSAGAIGNTITVIDPETGAVGPSVSIGSEPGKLAISDNYQYLYVALDGAAAVRRYDIATQKAGLQFSLGSDSFFGPYYAEDIAVLPGNPGSVAISRYQFSSPRHAGVAIFDDGVMRPTVTPGHTGSNVIEFSASSTRLYGYNNETTEYGFRRMAIDASGVSIIDATPIPLPLSGVGVDITFDSGLIYASSGAVIDPEARVIIGTFPITWTYASSVKPDSATGRVYILSRDINRSIWTMQVFDQGTFAFLGSMDIEGISGTAVPTSLVRWGNKGLAFRTNQNQVFLIRTDLIP